MLLVETGIEKKLTEILPEIVTERKVSEILYGQPRKLLLREIIYYVVIIFLVLALYALPTRNSTVISIATYIILILNFILFFFTVRNRRGNFSIILILVIFIMLLINLFINNAFLGKNLIVVIDYLSMFMIVYYSDYIPATKKTIDFIAVITCAISLIFIYLYFSPLAYFESKSLNKLQYFESNVNALSLGYSNSNQTAIFLMMIILVLTTLIIIYKKTIVRVIFACLEVFLIYMLYLTDSRTALSSIIVFITILFLGIKIRITRALVFMILLSVSLYVFILPLIFYSGILDVDAKILDKPIYTGREILFLKVLDDANKSVIFGNIAKFKFGNMHNGMLAIYASAGIVNVILYIWFFSINISRRFDMNNKYSYVALLGVLCVYIDSFSEAAMIVGGSMYGVLNSLLYVLANVKTQPQVKY